MVESTLKARVIHTHDIEDNWNKIPQFIPKKGEIIIYDKDEFHNSPRFKIGDGVLTIRELPFADASILEEIFSWEEDIGYIDGGKISSY